MVTGETCSTCKFFAALPKECRKNPPTVMLMQGPGGQSMSLGVFAPSKPENWCGAWASSERPQ
jgi:hypothetical protein